jgi:hypothetical protein
VGSNYYSGDTINRRSFQSDDAAYRRLKSYLEDDNNNPTWMFIYDGHANTGGIYSYDFYYSLYYNINTIDRVTNSSLDLQPFGFGFACLLGNIYANNNFAREWLTCTEGGVTFLGATTESFLDPDRDFSRLLFEQIKDKRPIMTIGELVGNAKAKYYHADKEGYRRRQAKKYVLYGDPSLYLFGLDVENPYPRPRPLMPEKKSINHDVNIEGLDNVESIYIYSITGQLLRVSFNQQIDLQGLPAGIYTIVLNSNNNCITKKILLQ